MKTLYEQLSTENIELVKNDFKNFPNSYELLVNELKSKHFANDLPLKYCLFIYYSIFGYEIFDQNKFYELFNN